MTRAPLRLTVIRCSPWLTALEWSYSKDSSVNPAGDYFAIDNVVITESAVTLGDVNGDGEIDITDVTLLIDAVLSGNMSTINPAAADCHADGEIDISDVTVLIDRVLNGVW